MLSPVSPSATGKTLRSFTSSLRDSRCAWAAARTRRKRSIEGSATSGRSLSSLGYFARFEAAGADVDAAARLALGDPDLLQVRVEAPARRHHRVASRIAERGALAAAVTDLGHRTREVS